MRLLLSALVLVALVACGGQSPTATPVFTKYTADGVLKALGITDAQDGRRGTAEPWPNVHSEWKVFPYAGVSVQQRGGQVLIYKTQQDLAAMAAYIERLPADVKVYSYIHANALLFLSSQVAKADAEKLRAAFEGLP